MAIGRRLHAFNVKLVNRHYKDYAQDLELFLKNLWEESLGIPGGFLATAATTIQAGVAALAGTLLAGWAAADHVHAVETASPANPTGTAAQEGTGTALMRADATILQGIVTTKGDVLGFAAVPARIPVGANGQVLTSNSATALGVQWANVSDGSLLFDFFLLGA